MISSNNKYSLTIVRAVVNSYTLFTETGQTCFNTIMQSYKSVLTSYYNVNACVCAGLLKTAQCTYVCMCLLMMTAMHTIICSQDLLGLLSH